MSHPRKINLPTQSMLWSRIGQGDFLDCYVVRSDLPARTAAEVATHFPPWVRGLLYLRGLITAPFGLSNNGPEAPDKLGMFPVESDANGELIAGFDDSHLNFRISVLSHQGQVSLATWVHPHHFGGKLYLRCILPFHILVVRNALARVARNKAAPAG
ncbi:MAG: hypothetical protein ACJAVM_000701 [Sulfitobacter sp.]|jgi:Protein of unknown function (DUF2867)